MDVSEVEPVSKIAAKEESDLIIIASPNAALPGPQAAVEILSATKKPIILITDDPARKETDAFKAKGLGYIIVQGDPMIGAKQAFLDPTEMALFNADIIRVLAGTGVFRLIHTVIDQVLKQIGDGETPELPQLIVNKETAVKYSGMKNPYAHAKAMASYEIARRVGTLASQGTFKVKEKARYLPILSAAHEMLRSAALLADEAREIEKANDSVARTTHFKDGSLHKKSGLFDKYD
jgi:methylenetetrahydromethanopterin dehydrogenase